MAFLKVPKRWPATWLNHGLSPKRKGPVLVCGCFISTVRWKDSLFLRFSPWGEPRIKHFVSQRRTRRRSVRREPRIRHFLGYPFGASRKKASTIFYNTAKGKTAVTSSCREADKTPHHTACRKNRGKALRRQAIDFGCVIENDWCFISLKFQRNNQENSPITEPTSGKFGEKYIFSVYCWNKTTMYYDRAFCNGSHIPERNNPL